MRMNWRRHCLYVGDLYVGEVMRAVPEGWRDFSMYKNLPDAPQHIKDNAINKIRYYESHQAKPWRAWVMKSEDGDELGYFETEDAARVALVEYVMVQLS